MVGVSVSADWLLGSGGSSLHTHQTAHSPAATPPVAIVNGITVVTLETATQIQNGIRVEALTRSENRTKITAYCTVLDL